MHFAVNLHYIQYVIQIQQYCHVKVNIWYRTLKTLQTFAHN